MTSPQLCFCILFREDYAHHCFNWDGESARQNTHWVEPAMRYDARDPDPHTNTYTEGTTRNSAGKGGAG